MESEDEKKEFLSALGLEETGLSKIIRAGYDLLGLQTYFTAGPKEVRAWTFIKGSKAPQCAGIIHSDFERGFIRAETIAYDDFVKFGGEQACKEAGKCVPKEKTISCKTEICLIFFSTSKSVIGFFLKYFLAKKLTINPGCDILRFIKKILLLNN